MATSPVVIDPATGERVQGGAPQQRPQIDPATGERIAAPQAGGTGSVDLSNKGGEGTYNMWDTGGKMHPVPYSLVPVARGKGFQFDTNKNPSGLLPAQQFLRDEAADPNRTGGTSLPMAAAGQQWQGQPEPQSRQESMQRLADAETHAPLPVRVATGIAKGGATLARPAIDAMNLGMGANGNTPAEQSFMMEGRTPAETAAKVGTIGAAMAPGAVAAPLATALGLGAGAAGGAAGSGIANALGADPKLSAVVGDVAGLGAGAAAGGAVGKLVEKWNSPLGDMVTKPRGTVAPESASPAELKAYADEHGIPLNAAQATQNNLPLNLQSAGERATLLGTPVKQQIKAGQAAITDHARNLMDAFSSDTPDMATAGQKIQENVAAALEREKASAEQAYAAVDANAGGVKVNLKPLKQEAAELLKDSSFIRQNASTLDPKRASTVVQAVQGLPDTATFTQAQQLRSALLEESRHPDVVISQLGQGWIKRLSGLTDRQMMGAAASAKPELMSQFRDANAQWEGMQEAFNNPRSPLYQTLQETDPNKVPQKFMTKGQIGGSPYNAELLDRYGIDKGPIKWALVGDMMNKDFGLYQGGKNVAGYSDGFLKSMFEPQELDAVYKTGAIARSLKANTNPSGTAGVESAISDVENPVKAIPKAIAAFATNNAWFNKWLMSNPPPRVTEPMAYRDWLEKSFQVANRGAVGSAVVQGGENDYEKKQ